MSFYHHRLTTWCQSWQLSKECCTIHSKASSKKMKQPCQLLFQRSPAKSDFNKWLNVKKMQLTMSRKIVLETLEKNVFFQLLLSVKTFLLVECCFLQLIWFIWTSSFAWRALIEKISFDHSFTSTIIQSFQSKKPCIEMNQVKIINVHGWWEKQVDTLRLIDEFLSHWRQSNGRHLINFHCAFENFFFVRGENV